MTSTMPPAPSILSTPKTAPVAAPKNNSPGGFSETFRNQVDSTSRDKELAPGGAATAVPVRALAAAAKSEAVDGAATLHHEAVLPDGPESLVDELLPGSEIAALDSAATLHHEAVLPDGPEPLVDELLPGSEIAALVAPAAPPAALAAAANVHGEGRLPPVVTRPNIAAGHSPPVRADLASGEADTPGLRNRPPSMPAGEALVAARNGAPGVEHELFAEQLARVRDPAPAPAVSSPAALAPIAANSTQVPAALPAPLKVDTPLAHPNWSEAIGTRLVWSAAQGIQSASISLNPRELGPVRVNLTMTDDEASVSFVSQHAVVREAIEAALPRLRELFSDEGITLADVSVSNGDTRSPDGGEAGNRDGRQEPAFADDPNGVELVETRVRGLDSLVDTFA